MKPISPATLSKWPALAFGLAIGFILLWKPHTSGAALFGLVTTSWVVGPAWLSALGVRYASSRVATWAFLGAEWLVIASTAWLWVYLVAVAPDAQNGIALIIFPILQYAAVTLVFLVVAVASWGARKVSMGAKA